jgi:uncharacterized protein with ParB-like and HNH nuclease domain
MKAAESTLSEILSSTKVYEIPEYQRPYSWECKHVEELMNDLYEAFENESSEYFIGSIIVIEKEKTFEVIDGQQRLTTLTLVLAKLKDLISNPLVKNGIQEKIMPIDIYSGETKKPKLLVRAQDRKFFEHYVLAGEHDLDKIEALKTTQQRMVENLVAIEEFLDGKKEEFLIKFTKYLIEQVSMVFVKTENFDSAYRLFNVLNARGLSLANSDLLKNTLFGQAKSESEKDSVKASWNKLEDLVGLENLDIFLSHHRTAIVGEKQVKTLFKDYEDILKKYIGTPSDFCSELLKSAHNYKKIIDVSVADEEKVKRLIFSLKNVSYDEWIPALLAFMNNKISDISLTDFLSLLEKRTMHNWVLRLGRTKRNTIYYTTIKAINANESGNKIIEILKEGASNKNFLESLSADVYGMPYATAVLLRIDYEMHDKSASIQFNDVSVEHVLPQKMDSDYWKTRYTVEQHQSWVHKLGNLTLLSGRKNSAAQNYDFEKKKDVYLSRGISSFYLTKKVCDETNWTVEILEKRQKELLEKAAEIWNI